MTEKDYSFVWMENLLTMQEIVELMENCDKECASCSKDEKNDCLIEMRESIHSLAKSFQDAIFSFIQMLSPEDDKVECRESTPGFFM